ncbi:MAG: cytochrome c biogenesis protein CcdA [Bacteroidia bacterium]
MKKIQLKVFALLAFVLVVFSLSAQILNPISWKFSQKQVNDSEYVLTLEANIPKGWHIFSQYEKSSIPTSFTFSASSDYGLKGKVNEEKPIAQYDKVIRDTARFFLNHAVFTQEVAVRNPAGFTIMGNVSYQTCNDSMCLPPKQADFSFTIPAAPESYWSIFFAGIGAGLLALLTPCVFPMVPLTVSFFIKRSSKKKKGIRDATLYSLSIIFIYVLLGVIVTAIFGKDALNALASNGWVNLAFFLIFVIFGLSFLGAFEITLPSSWANRLDKASERGGFSGIFFMALTLCIVSFSCTGPVLGNLIALAAQNGAYWNLTVGLLGFSLALSVPFALFAVFPSWLTSLPKSGGWMNNIKVVFGLFELAFALKFLSVTDLVGLHIKWLHLHLNGPIGILHREIFLVLWIVIFAILGFYLLGKLKFYHDSDVEYISVFRLLVAIIAFSFSLYLIPGLFGAPLKLISGFPPPSQYNEGWKLGGSSSVLPSQSGNVPLPQPKKGTKIGCPLDLNCFHDYDEAMAYAKQVNKPVMIDFTGLACTNCRRMEENVWSDPRVLSIINNDYVLVSLYVDDPTELPDSMHFVSKVTGDKIETNGQKWSDFEAVGFKTNSQPYYALVDHDGKLLVSPRGYTPDIEQYIKFLTDGKNNYHPDAAKPTFTPIP